MKNKVIKVLIVAGVCIGLFVGVTAITNKEKAEPATKTEKIEEDTEEEIEIEIEIDKSNETEETDEETEVETEVPKVEIVNPPKTETTSKVVNNPEVKVETKTETKVESSESTDSTSTESSGKVSLGTFKLTAYCNCSKCCGQWAGGATASGVMPSAGRTIAVDTSIIPFGTRVEINGHTYVAEDTGGAIKGNKIDIYFGSHQEALNFGVKYAEVFVYK